MKPDSNSVYIIFKLTDSSVDIGLYLDVIASDDDALQTFLPTLC